MDLFKDPILSSVSVCVCLASQLYVLARRLPLGKYGQAQHCPYQVAKEAGTNAAQTGGPSVPSDFNFFPSDFCVFSRDFLHVVET